MAEHSGEQAQVPRAASLVIVFASAISGRRPTFHRWGPHDFTVVDIDQDDEVRTSTFKTACGLVMDHHRWVERRLARHKPVEIETERIPWVGLRFDNASLIGRPCGHCYKAVDFGSDGQQS